MTKGNGLIVDWGCEAEAVSVHSIEELDALLDHLDSLARATAPFLVVLVSDEGSSLTIGVGREESVAEFSDGSDEGASFASIPDPTRTGAPLVFELDGEPNEMLAELATPAEATREAARYFFANGGRDPALRWEAS
ncbi:MAG: Immunity protein Imm1 [Labilithrix sp.]|nr:Immunity protein Imm1 [Labilithrix sp.]